MNNLAVDIRSLCYQEHAKSDEAVIFTSHFVKTCTCSKPYCTHFGPIAEESDIPLTCTCLCQHYVYMVHRDTFSAKQPNKTWVGIIPHLCLPCQ